MPRGRLTKDEMKMQVLKLKNELHNLYHYDKELAHRYLNKVLDKIEEYRE